MSYKAWSIWSRRCQLITINQMSVCSLRRRFSRDQHVSMVTAINWSYWEFISKISINNSLRDDAFLWHQRRAIVALAGRSAHCNYDDNGSIYGKWIVNILFDISLHNQAPKGIVQDPVVRLHSSMFLCIHASHRTRCSYMLVFIKVRIHCVNILWSKNETLVQVIIIHYIISNNLWPSYFVILLLCDWLQNYFPNILSYVVLITTRTCSFWDRTSRRKAPLMFLIKGHMKIRRINNLPFMPKWLSIISISNRCREMQLEGKSCLYFRTNYTFHT